MNAKRLITSFLLAQTGLVLGPVFCSSCSRDSSESRKSEAGKEIDSKVIIADGNKADKEIETRKKAVKSPRRKRVKDENISDYRVLSREFKGGGYLWYYDLHVLLAGN